MKMRRSVLVTAGALACLAIPAMASPAAADSMVTGSCGVTGAYGAYTGFFVSKTRIDPLRLRAVDNAADGHHAAVRLSTVQNDGNLVAWSWHRNYGGNGSDQVWDTYATDAKGIAAVRIDVGLFEGNDLLKICTSTKKDNPYS
ncbi:hypothetical protein P1P75_39225 [Streptomyces sp. ID05-39B]|uniref:hypothetical protein n=1 Tax=Streptomyces sp. ID05-39B TaxID=3028664 RepID=UPI0029B13474|nr:hypothetical protein [Streptomyces sp. ID05-39B]MDX3532270.1 hypothetical protein [Streptomyces sp. ID05-39B]